MNQFVDATIKNAIKSKINSFSLTFEEMEDIYQSSIWDILEKLNSKNQTFIDSYYLIDSLLLDENRFKNEQFKKSCWYVKEYIVWFVNRNVLSLKWKKQPTPIKTDDWWEYVKSKNELNETSLEYETETMSEFNVKTLNFNIDLEIFYSDLQKYANLLLCLFNEDDLNLIKEIVECKVDEHWNIKKNVKSSIHQKIKIKFISQFVNMIKNIENERKWFDDNEIKELWYQTLEYINKNKSKDKDLLNIELVKRYRDLI